MNFLRNNIYLVVSIIAAILIIIGALYVKQANDGLPSYNADQLAQYNGKNSKECYVAIDTDVYEIPQGKLWQDGKHASSEGQAYCGVDLSDVIGQSPHGRSKLGTLEIVGIYEQ